MAPRTTSTKSLIETALSYARMEKASFGGVGSEGVIVLRTPEEIDAFVKERTRLYRNTWLIPPLERALAKVTKN